MNNPLWMKFGRTLFNMNNVLAIGKSPGGLLQIIALGEASRAFAPNDPGYAALDAFYESIQPWEADTPEAPAPGNAHGTAQRLVSDATRESK